MTDVWPASWTRSPLGEVADLNWGDTKTTKASYTPTGFPAFSASGHDGFLPYADFERTGVVVSAIGAYCGQTWLVRGKWSCIKNTIRFWSTSPEVDTEFLYWLTRNPAVWPQRGFAQTFISQGDARRLAVAYPPLAEQRAIAGVLGALDDKMELNRRMNETLEAIAQAEFRRMMEEGGRKPGKIEDLCTLSRETINPGEFPDETFDHYSIPAFDEGRLPKPETGESIKSNKFVVPANAAMISKLNPRIPRIWLPDVSTARRSIASTEFLIAIPKPGISREWLYGLFASQAFLDVFATMITGTSGSHQRVKPEYLLAMDIEIPPSKAIQQYTKAAAPLHKRIALNLQESRTLAGLRDALLPKLLSGAVRVSASAEASARQEGTKANY